MYIGGRVNMLIQRITLIIFIIITLIELYYFLFKWWRVKRHRQISPYLTKLVILLGWVGVAINVLNR